MAVLYRLLGCFVGLASFSLIVPTVATSDPGDNSIASTFHGVDMSPALSRILRARGDIPQIRGIGEERHRPILMETDALSRLFADFTSNSEEAHPDEICEFAPHLEPRFDEIPKARPVPARQQRNSLVITNELCEFGPEL